MDKTSYLNKIRHALVQLSDAEIQVIIDYYDNLINKENLAEASEEILNQKFGEPSIISHAILEKYKQSTQDAYRQNGWQEFHEEEFNDYSDEKQPARHRILRHLIQMMGLIFINLFFMIWVIISVAAVLFAGWICSIAFLSTPFIILGAVFTSYLSNPVLSISTALDLFGLGVIGFYICKSLTKYFFKFTHYYLNANLQILRGTN